MQAINERDFNWMIDHGPELFEKYAGKWIAVRDGEVVGVGDTAPEAAGQLVVKLAEAERRCCAHAEQKSKEARDAAIETLKIALSTIGLVAVLLSIATFLGLGPVVKGKVDHALQDTEAKQIITRLSADSGRVEELRKKLENTVNLGAFPIGSIVAWHQNINEKEPLKLPAGWVPCTNPPKPGEPRRKIREVAPDCDPILAQMEVPNLNRDSDEGRFLRGGTQSGQMQEDAFQGHGHNFLYGKVAKGGGDVGAPQGPDANPTAAPDVITGEVDVGHGKPRIAAETRPKNMSVVWIMRVK